MASPPSLRSDLVFPRIPPTGWKTLKDAETWARALTRALDNNADKQGAIPVGTNVITPAAYPYTVQLTDLIVLVDTTAARVINLPEMTSGFRVNIKDNTGTASVNNITVTALAGEFIDGAATFVMATNFQSVILLGTGIVGNEWTVVSQ